MTKDQLKQEIITNIKPNFRQEIAGSTLQQVLLDTVDLISLSGSGSGDLPSDVATRQWVLDQDYATEGQLEQEVRTLNEKIDQIVPPEIDLSNYVEKDTFEEFTGSVADTYATERDLRLTSESISSSLNDYATKELLNSTTSSLSQSIAQVRSEIPSLEDYATKELLNSVTSSLSQSIVQVRSEIPSLEGYATQEYVSESVAHATIDTSSLATKSDLNQATSSLSSSIAEVASNIPDVSNFVTSQQVTSSINALSSSVAQTYETKTDFQTVSGSFNTRINDLSSAIPDVSSFPTRTEVTTSINAATSSLSSSLNQRINQVEQEIPSLSGYATQTYVSDNYVDKTAYSQDSGSFDTRINQKADTFVTTYPTGFSGTVNCQYDMTVATITDSSELSIVLSLSNAAAGKVVHCVFIASSAFTQSWSLAIPTTLNDLPVYLNGTRLTSGDTLTLNTADTAVEMSILITSISVNIIAYQN